MVNAIVKRGRARVLAVATVLIGLAACGGIPTPPSGFASVTFTNDSSQVVKVFDCTAPSNNVGQHECKRVHILFALAQSAHKSDQATPGLTTVWQVSDVDDHSLGCWTAAPVHANQQFHRFVSDVEPCADFE